MQNYFSRSILKDALFYHVRELSDVIGHRSILNQANLQKAAQYIGNEMQKYGYNVEFQKYYVPDIKNNLMRTTPQQIKGVYNIVATKRGQRTPEEVIVIGAHYDSCNSPGADDNASGVAGMLEIARMLADIPLQRTVQFVGFTNEEPPFFQTDLMGSRVYTKAARKHNIEIKLAIILEMIGYFSHKPLSQQIPQMLQNVYPTQGNFIMALGDDQAMAMLQELAVIYNSTSKVPMMTNKGFEEIMRKIEGFDFSDHWSFWEEGYPAVMVTDTAFLRNPNYHTETDTYGTLNYEKMAEVVVGLSQALYHFINRPK